MISRHIFMDQRTVSVVGGYFSRLPHVLPQRNKSSFHNEVLKTKEYCNDPLNVWP